VPSELIEGSVCAHSEAPKPKEVPLAEGLLESLQPARFGVEYHEFELVGS
jgi:hypothetical protein